MQFNHQSKTIQTQKANTAQSQKQPRIFQDLEQGNLKVEAFMAN